MEGMPPADPDLFLTGEFKRVVDDRFRITLPPELAEPISDVQGDVILAKERAGCLSLWRVADWVKTAGRGYSVSQGDGIAYSYSVFNDWPEIRRRCRIVHVVNTDGAGINPYRTAAHVAVLGLKR